MKCTSKRRSLPFTFLFCQVIVFSLALAYGITQLLSDPPAPESTPAFDPQQLFRNYRILNQFLANGSPPDSQTAGAADRETHPLLAAIEDLRRAQALHEEKKFRTSLAVLEAVPDDFPVIAKRRDALLLRNLHATGRSGQFLVHYDAHPQESVELRVMRLDSLVQVGRQAQALEEFKALFACQGLAVFRRVLARPALARLLGEFAEQDWLDKFHSLLKSNDYGEFRRLLPYSRYRELNRLFQAAFAYRGRAYGRARRLLRVPLPERYRPMAEAILLKADVRETPGLDVDERLQRISGDPALFSETLFDLAQILVGEREFAGALPFFRRYLETCTQRDEEYWKTAWLLAWIYYRRGDRETALEYFRLGGDSPVPGYRIASRYWQGKLEGGDTPDMTASPFSYYAVKVLEDKESFRDLHQGFLTAIDDPPGERFLEIVEDLKVLAGHGFWEEAMETIHWAKDDPRLADGDLNLLRIIESLLYYRQNRFFLAFSRFRRNFRHTESVRLPNFLSGLFFPRPYAELIAGFSREQEVDPGLVFALIREESFFRSDARSRSNAMGLMQLLLGTARQVADGSGLKVKARDLFDPKVNIRLGLNYLKTLLERYDGHLYLALAAYNAGPHRVDQWLRDFPEADEEEFIEMIPFSETRTYVKNILRNYFFYRYYYENGSE
ncbi:MAG: lytic transglycosylase domain-containing protein [Candidatus Aminicenantes bacterium]|nr:lytic transglycosylase domain-containing protein [Candidatus Aminicenantes bacterium]